MVSARRGVAIIIIAHCRRPQGRYRSRSTGYVNLGMMIQAAEGVLFGVWFRHLSGSFPVFTDYS